MADKVREKIGEGDKYKLTLEYFTDGEGTGGALLPFKKFFTSNFIVFNSSQNFTGNLEKIVAFHKKNSAVATTFFDNNDSLTGLYVFEPEVFNYIPKGFSMIENDVIPKLVENGELINHLSL